MDLSADDIWTVDANLLYGLTGIYLFLNRMKIILCLMDEVTTNFTCCATLYNVTTTLL